MGRAEEEGRVQSDKKGGTVIERCLLVCFIYSFVWKLCILRGDLCVWRRIHTFHHILEKVISRQK